MNSRRKNKRERKEKIKAAKKSRMACLLVRAAFVGVDVSKTAVAHYLSHGGLGPLRNNVERLEREQYGNTT